MTEKIPPDSRSRTTVFRAFPVPGALRPQSQHGKGGPNGPEVQEVGCPALVDKSHFPAESALERYLLFQTSRKNWGLISVKYPNVYIIWIDEWEVILVANQAVRFPVLMPRCLVRLVQQPTRVLHAMTIAAIEGGVLPSKRTSEICRPQPFKNFCLAHRNFFPEYHNSFWDTQINHRNNVKLFGTIESLWHRMFFLSQSEMSGNLPSVETVIVWWQDCTGASQRIWNWHC